MALGTGDHRPRQTSAALVAAFASLLACRPAPLTDDAQKVHPAVNQVLVTRAPEPPTVAATPAAAPAPAVELSAAALLAQGDAEGALEALGREGAAADGVAADVQKMLRARAARLAGRPGEAALALEPLVQRRRPPRGFPLDVVLHEYAQSLVEQAATEPGEAGDKSRLLAVAAWERAIDHEPVRIAAPMRIARARALAGVRTGERAAARRAVKALAEVLRDYPEYPDAEELELQRAQALVRAGEVAEGTRALRELAIRGAGTEAAVHAEGALSGLGKPIRWSAAEQLERAAAARRHRAIGLSRQILSELIDDRKTPASVRDTALRSRAATAHRGHDFAACADDLKVLYDRSPGAELREDLLRCLDKAGRYDQALALRLEQTRKRGGAAKAALWEAIELAVRGGRYARARELMDKIPAKERQRGERLWLDAWIKYRLGEREAAAVAFAAAERRLPSDLARAARYFRARALLAGETQDRGEGAGADRAEGEKLLLQLVGDDPLGYYGLQARQRLLDLGVDAGPPPALKPVPAETAAPPDHAAAQATFAALAADYGWALPSLERGAVLHAAGYVDEAQRELRAATESFEHLFGLGKGAWIPKHEDIVAGISWKATWKQPRLAMPREARKLVRERGAVDALRQGLFTLAWALEEPHIRCRMTPVAAGQYKSRWHPRAFRSTVERESTARGFDPTHLWALMYTESRFRKHVVSSSGARGPIQIMPWTGEQLAARLGEPFDVDALFDATHNVRLSAYYFSELLTKFHGQAALAYASYNGGPFNVARWLAAKGAGDQGAQALELDVFIAEIPFRETANYTRRVLEVQAAYQLMYDGTLPRWQNTVDLKVEDNIDF
jgi:soluble lytic murein transglycosylase-like protein